MIKILKLNIINGMQISDKDKKSLLSLLNEESQFAYLQNSPVQSMKLASISHLSAYRENNIGGLDCSWWFSSCEKGEVGLTPNLMLDYICQYNLVILQDKINTIHGYILFDTAEIDLFGSVSNIVSVSHMYISNSLNGVQADKLLFDYLEDNFEASVIYSKIEYPYCRPTRGYICLSNLLTYGKNTVGVVKLKAGSKYNLF